MMCDSVWVVQCGRLLMLSRKAVKWFPTDYFGSITPPLEFPPFFSREYNQRQMQST